MFIVGLPVNHEVPEEEWTRHHGQQLKEQCSLVLVALAGRDKEVITRKMQEQYDGWYEKWP